MNEFNMLQELHSHHYPAGDILDRPEVEGQKKGDGDEDTDEGRREVSAENVDEERCHSEDLLAGGEGNKFISSELSHTVEVMITMTILITK